MSVDGRFATVTAIKIYLRNKYHQNAVTAVTVIIFNHALIVGALGAIMVHIWIKRRSMAEDDKIPEYLKKLQKLEHVVNADNFGPEDVGWTGEDGALNTDALIYQHGQDPHPPIILLLKALIKGQTPDACVIDIGKRLRKAMASINGRDKSGREEQDDNDALLEIAWLYFEKLYECGLDTSQVIELRPIVRSVVEAHFSDVPDERNIEIQSYIEKLEDKFNKDKNLYFTRATSDNDWERLDQYKKLKQALNLLAELGIPVDLETIKPRRLRKNQPRARDETPTT